MYSCRLMQIFIDLIEAASVLCLIINNTFKKKKKKKTGPLTCQDVIHVQGFIQVFPSQDEENKT